MNRKIFVLIVVVLFFGVAWVAHREYERYKSNFDIERPVVISPETQSCLVCHKDGYQPFAFENWLESEHAKEEVGCESCHLLSEERRDDVKKIRFARGIGKSECKDENVSHIVPAFVCADCHSEAATGFASSKHGASWNNTTFKMHWNIIRAQEKKVDMRDAIEDLKLDCKSCHQIEFTCHMCHVAHRFSAERARNFSSCSVCHSEVSNIYAQFPEHLELTEEGMVGAESQTCASCHMPESNHDVYGNPLKSCGKCHVRRSAYQRKSVKHSFVGDAQAHKEFKSLFENSKSCMSCHPSSKKEG